MEFLSRLAALYATLFRKKSVDYTVHQAKGNKGLQKALGAFDLTMLGVGAVIGTGIFVLTGVVAAEHSGPAIVLSFLLSGVACAFAALCYAEFASMIPASGSAYTYGYTVFGELFAWILGWDLILEYGLACSVVASGWSAYFQELIRGFGLHLPTEISSAFNPSTGTYFDLMATVIVFALSLILLSGVKESSRINNIMVLIKIGVVILFIVVGAFYVQPTNWTPFMPFGFDGVVQGAATAFLSYIGFDAVSSASEEVRNPQRDMPIGLLSSLAVCMVLYVAVSLVLTGMVPYTKLNVGDPVAFALRFVHQDWVAGFVSLGAILGITTVLFVMMYGQTRLFFAISRDGLLPKSISRLTKGKKTPVFSILLTWGMATIFSALIPLGELAQLVNIGTLFAFICVSIGVVVLRIKRPDIKRNFKVPFVYVIPFLSVLACGYLMINLTGQTWIRFIIWFVIGLVIYFTFGFRHSELGKRKKQEIHS
ncbi:amino acid permease [Sporolactobacillus inulinus]|jgi:APA family basic amino acid/polyamine antiporter|uniref:Amino acid permease n=1 Tax=Sporolactobacillus inulinus CASD TaxID=1069536 RepID=A0A0U1QKZ1_9BACL|nr:amino acid permease [Sporolactobacillus inulinus]KLI01485.1 amino acid permease [Sporolactobacillus inulinus CASD]GEB76889.1 amino acid transporter [Sporolactobacillus inulinus]